MRNLGTQPVLSASTLTGDSVVNSYGEDLGRIEDFMLDLENGRIRYAVLSFGGFMGVDTENKQVILEIERARLENAPGFDKNEWPDTTEPDWQVDIYEFFDATPYWR